MYVRENLSLMNKKCRFHQVIYFHSPINLTCKYTCAQQVALLLVTTYVTCDIIILVVFYATNLCCVYVVVDYPNLADLIYSECHQVYKLYSRFPYVDI